MNPLIFATAMTNVTDIQILILIVAGVLGILVSILSGWSTSNEPFDPKKFVQSFLIGLSTLLGFLIATIALSEPVGIIEYGYMFAATAGIEVVAHRVIKSRTD